MSKKEVDKVIKDKVAETCKQVVMQDEILKLRKQNEEQLIQARQQLVFWDTKVKQLSGSQITYNQILAKSQKTKTLELESENIKPKKA